MSSNSPALNHHNSSSKSETLFGFVNTLSRTKKRFKEVESLQDEGRTAIDGSTVQPIIDSVPEDFVLNELEERRMIEPRSADQSDFVQLQRILVNWINDELSDQRIIVRNLAEDLHDGQILGKLIEKLAHCKLDVIEVTLNEDLQKGKLRAVLDTTNRSLGLSPGSSKIRWSVEQIHNKDLVHIIHLLVAIVRYFRSPIRLPSNVTVKVVVVQKQNGLLHSRVDVQNLTPDTDGPRSSSASSSMFDDQFDEFDRLCNESMETIQCVKRSIYEFTCFHLFKLNIECEQLPNQQFELDPIQFSDGLLFIFLIGMCQGYFVPLGNIFTTPNEQTLTEVEAAAIKMDSTQLHKNNYVNTASLHKLHNVNVAFQLMEDAGIEVRNRVRSEDVINSNSNSIFRILFMIHSKYKDYAY